MKRLFTSIILLIIVFSCSKDQKTINKLEGNWELVKYSQTYSNGLSALIESTGTISFSSYKSREKSNCTYSRSQTYSINGIVSDIQEAGNYTINDEGKGLKINILQVDGTYSNDIQLEVNTVTSTDLKIVGVFDNINHLFIYKKKK